MQCRELFARIDAMNDAYLKVWEDVCNIESPTNYKAGVDAVGEYFIQMAEARGWKVEVFRQEVAGNAICITLNPEVDAPAVTFSGHIDTVHPVGLFGSPAVRKDEEWIYGPGVSDCKGGVVASFMAMDALAQCGFKARPVQLIIQSDEETGSKTSGKKTVEYMVRKAKGSVAFLNTEPFNGEGICIARKGILRYQFNVRGIAAHSSICQEGANAVVEAALKLLKLEKLKDADGLTCNCGVIRGGTVANTVAEECSFLADIRFADPRQCEEAKVLVRAVAETNEIKGCTCELVEVSYRPPMPLVERNESLLKKIHEIYEANKMPLLPPYKRNGGADSAYITEAGIPCLDGFGVHGKREHSVEECAELKSLAVSAKRLAAVAFCI